MAPAASVQLHMPDGTECHQPTGIFIDNEFRLSQDETVFETLDPLTQKPICSIARGQSADVDHAVKAAAKAYLKWKDTATHARGKLISTLADLIERDADVLARLEAVDAGKPIKIAKQSDVLAAAACLRYFAGWADKVRGDTIETDANTLNMTIREPLGVCGLIIPWNFPILICAWKLGPCLATGNTVVMKPAELTPLSTLYIGKLIAEAGFPAGVVNIVPGFGQEAGAALSRHPGVKKISFTGSTPVGKGLLRESADTLKKTTLELGGKSPSIVFSDVDIDQVVEWVNGGIFYNMGQNCCAGSRVYVHKDIYETFLDKLVARARDNVIGDPFDDKTFLGPQISAAHHGKIVGMIEKAKEQGAVCAYGGRSRNVCTSAPTGDGGWFVEPTIFRDVMPDMEIAREEVFGPVVAVAPFETADEALALANDSCFGLAAGVFTSDLKLALRFAKGLEAGSVWVNGYGLIAPQLGFGGFKQSGIGKDLGEDALKEYTQSKTVRFML